MLISFNMLGARLFGELEFWFSIIKIVTIIAMIIVGLVMIFFSFKTSYGHASFSNLTNHGGIFPNGPFGFLMAFQIAVYSFIGIELIGVTAGETKDPRNVIPKAINNVPIRILLFYVGGLLVIMSVIPWNKIDSNSSPFVTMFSLIGLPFAAGLVNFVVLTAAASATNSGIYSNSRILFGLAKQGLGPKVLSKTNGSSVPYLSMLVSSATLLAAALLNFIFPDAIKLFIYVTTLSTVLFLVVWAMIIISYIVFVKRIQKNTIRINLNSLVDLRQHMSYSHFSRLCLYYYSLAKIQERPFSFHQFGLSSCSSFIENTSLMQKT